MFLLPYMAADCRSLSTSKSSPVPHYCAFSMTHAQIVAHPKNYLLGLWLLIDPVELGLFVGNDVFFVEPQGDFLLGIFDAVGAVADVAAHILKSQTLV